MIDGENKEMDFLVNTISKHAQVELSLEQRNAAFAVLRSLPKSSTLIDFENACLGKQSMTVKVSTDVIEILQPVGLALERNNSYAGRFASLFDQQTETT